MRVDVEAEFYVRVRPERPAVAMAASTLGRRTLEPETLHALLSGKFESAMRAVAAELDMGQIHENRGSCVTRVKEAAQEDLTRNGLELESVAILVIDQTALEYFNPSNRFDAEGLTALIREIEDRRKLRNDIEQDTMIQIRARNLEAEKPALDIDRESETARLAQERDLEFRRAQQRSELARERATRDTEAEEAQINARETVEKARISNDRSIAEARINSERDIRSREIARTKAVEADEIAARESTERLRIAQGAQREIARVQALREAEIESREDVERARIASERELEEIRIDHGMLRRKLEVLREPAVESAQMEKAIVLYKKSPEKLAARAESDAARAVAALSEEKVKTVRETEVAQPRKAIDVLMAEKAAAESRLMAEAAAIRHAVGAEAARLINEAENILTDEARHSLFKRKMLEHVAGIVAASVKPMEKIQDIRIMQLAGMGGGEGSGGGQPDRRSHQQRPSLPRAGPPDRQHPERHRHRGRHFGQADRPDPRGIRHAAHRAGPGQEKARGEERDAARLCQFGDRRHRCARLGKGTRFQRVAPAGFRPCATAGSRMANPPTGSAVSAGSICRTGRNCASNC